MDGLTVTLKGEVWRDRRDQMAGEGQLPPPRARKPRALGDSCRATPLPNAGNRVPQRCRLPLQPGTAGGIRMRGSFPAVGLVSTFPPTQCGIASFAQALVNAWAVESPRTQVGVARIVGPDDASRVPGVVMGRLEPTVRASVTAAARELNRYDCALIQHEFGIFGPDDGVAVLGILDELRVPLVVTLHTVLSHPTGRQRMIIEELVARSFRTIVLSGIAKTRLRQAFDVPTERVVEIPHGTHRTTSPGSSGSAGDDPEVLTWGLIGPDKGIEWAVRSITRLRDIGVTYRVVGQTHPKVVANEGEAYRHRLERLVQRLDLEQAVHFENRYVDLATLARRIGRARAVILPYDSSEQVVSGVLAESVAAQIPVVATPFPHAVEMAATGAVALAAHADPEAMANALREVIIDPQVRARMMAAQARLAPRLAWSSVASETYDLICRATSDLRVA